MAYLSLYRKWRPQIFSEVVGQEHIVRTLTNALATGRVAHAYLFSGPRGTGKTTFARLLAKGLNCEDGPTGTPCNNCDSCQQITRGSAVDVLEIDGASNRGIDEIRELRDRVRYAPTGGRYKVYIIDEVHMLTNEAFNALLKVLEEPPSHVVFVFATTEAQKVPATILSRCQKFDFRRFSTSQLTGHLKHVAEAEQVVVELSALALIARHAEGSMRDALAIMDQCLAAQPDKLDLNTVTTVLGIVRRQALIQLLGHILQGELGASLLLINTLLDQGVEVRQLTRDLISYARDLVLMKAAPTEPELVVVDEGERQIMQDQVAKSDLSQLLRVVDALVATEAELRWSPNPTMAMEIAMVKAVEAAREVGDDSIVKRLVALEDDVRQVLSGVGLAQTQAPTTTGSKAASFPTQEQDAADDVPAVNVEIPTTVQEEIGGSSEVEEISDELQKLRSRWPEVLASLKKERMISTEAFLREGVPCKVDGQAVTICFSSKHGFHKANVEDAAHKGHIEKAVSSVMGRAMRINTVSGELPSSSSAAVVSNEMEADDAEDDIMDHPSVAKAVKYFGGTPRRIES